MLVIEAYEQRNGDDETKESISYLKLTETTPALRIEVLVPWNLMVVLVKLGYLSRKANRVMWRPDMDNLYIACQMNRQHTAPCHRGMHRCHTHV